MSGMVPRKSCGNNAHSKNCGNASKKIHKHSQTHCSGHFSLTLSSLEQRLWQWLLWCI